MEKIKTNFHTEKISEEICINAALKANYFPIDRHFLESYMVDILKIEPIEFIFCNFENVNNTYTVQLFCCLPELWQDIGYDELLLLLNSFTNIHSYFTFINFTYKYLGIDMIDRILDIVNNNKSFTNGIKEFLLSQYPNLIIDEDTIAKFSDDILGLSFDSFQYIKQKLLLDYRILPALKTIEELRIQVEKYKK